MEDMNTSADEEVSVFTSSSEAGDEDAAVGLRPYSFEPLRECNNNGSDTNSNSDDEPIEEQRLLDLQRCTCGSCAIMPTAKECKCCREYDEYMAEMNAIQPVVGCIATHPGFAGVCLHPQVLRTAYKVYRQQYGNIPGDMNRRNRYTAYRQLVRWCYEGFLGKDVRVVVPSCAVLRIREAFPSIVYTGFLESNNNN